MQKALKTLQTLGLPVYYREHRSDWAKEPVLPWATVWVTPNVRTLVEVGNTADRDGLSSPGPPNVYGRGRGMQSRVPSVYRCASGTGDYTSDAVKALPKRLLLFDTAWRTAYLLGIEACRVELIYAGGRWQIYDIGPGLSGLSKKDVSERDLTERERTRSDRGQFYSSV
ncbi:MAG: hypothetical protein IMX04_08500 [Candidatus Carbobacillus altaicus]|nr:hypothetical protein [Candidatus Carbobacillus altaicus]